MFEGLAMLGVLEMAFAKMVAEMAMVGVVAK